MKKQPQALSGEPAKSKRKTAAVKKSPRKQDDIMKLRLYVAGQTPKSIAAFANLKKACEEYLPGKYLIEVIDLIQNPQLARGDQILAIPTVVRRLPVPIRKMIGDLSNREKLLVGLEFKVVNQ